MLIWYINYIECNIDLNVNEKATISNYKIKFLFVKFTKDFDFFNQCCWDNYYYNKCCHFIYSYDFISVFYFSQANNLLNLKSGCIIRSILVLFLEVFLIIILLYINYFLVLCLELCINIHLINVKKTSI